MLSRLSRHAQEAQAHRCHCEPSLARHYPSCSHSPTRSHTAASRSPFYALVGRVASEWAHLEHILDLTIYDLANSRVKGSVLPANVLACIKSQIMGVGPRCKAIILLATPCGLGKEDVVRPFNALMNAAYKPADQRARFVHDPWYMDTESKAPAQFRAMPYSDPLYGYKEITQTEAEQTIDKIRDLQHRASKLRSTVLDALQASAKKRA